jgi:internalin A
LHGGNLTVWDDGNIPPGSNWLAEIDRAIASARIAVLLVSKDFLASSFIERKEFPDLLKRRGEGMGFFWVPIEYTLYKYTPLRDIQAVWPADRPLIGLSKADQSHALNEIATKLAEWRPE